MRNLSILAMIFGVLATLSSIYFTIVHKQYGTAPIVLFWGLLSGFEFFSAWFWLLSKTRVMSYFQKLTLATLAMMTVAWVIIMLTSDEPKSILLWALKTLNYSGIYFIGLIINYQSRKNSSHNQGQ